MATLKRYYPHKRYRITVLIISIALLVSALTQPAFYVAKSEDPAWGSAVAFFFGFFGVIEMKAGISWMANPFLIGAWVALLRNAKIALISALIAILFVLAFLAFKTITVDEAGNTSSITGLATGYYLWLCSMAVIFTGAFALYIYELRKRP